MDMEPMEPPPTDRRAYNTEGHTDLMLVTEPAIKREKDVRAIRQQASIHIVTIMAVAVDTEDTKIRRNNCF